MKQTKKTSKQPGTQVEIPFEFDFSHLQDLSQAQLIELVIKQAKRIGLHRGQLFELERLVLQMRKTLKN